MAKIKIQTEFDVPDECFEQSVEKALKNNPDFVLVTRCNDCKKWEYDENFSGWCVEWRRRTLGDHFCSYGERREGE